MTEIGNNVYLILEIVRADKSGVAYNLFMRASKPFNQFIKAHQSIGAEIRDSFLSQIKGICANNGQTRSWWHRNKLHRIDGPAREHTCPNGWEEWYYRGLLHRAGGPAATDSFKRTWFQNGLLHREDGPARVYAHGAKHYFINGVLYANRSAYYARHIPRRPRSERIKNRQNPY
jgi:hypothetical protein